MALGALEAQLKAMTECKICFESKDHQKQLPCQHTLCLDCLNKLKVEGGKYRCPICNVAYLVPNGGFETLPESLITKQLAALLQTREWETAATQQVGEGRSLTQNTEGAVSVTAKEDIPETEAGKKLKFAVQQGRNTLAIAQQKIERCSLQQVELAQNLEKLEAKINEMKAEKIAEIEAKAKRKIDAMEKATQIKITEVESREEHLKSALVKNTEIMDELESLAADLDCTQTEQDVTLQLQRAHESVTEMKELFTPPESVTLKAGDSVRLRMDIDEIKPNFLEKNMTHADVGYIHQTNEKEQCSVVFPTHSAWCGKLSQIEKSATKHDLPVIGDRVRVKAEVKDPDQGWGVVKPGCVGILRKLKNCGKPQRREVEVDFPEDHSWDCFFDELEIAPPEPLLVGDEVWVKKEITEPAGGWAGVTHSSKGTLLSVNGDDVLVNFTECREWRGLLTELEKVRPISVGDKVKVMKSVSEPKTGWAGVSHTDEGIVKLIHDHDEYGKVAAIDFPNRLGLWKCVISELELVERQADKSGGSLEIQLSGGLEEMQRMHHRVMERQAEQCTQQ